MTLRICVVIPTYNNSRTISEVLRDVIVNTPFPVLVVDDGSETPVLNSLYSFEVKHCLENGRVRVVRFEKNRGKGVALQHAIRQLSSEGFTHMVTMDGDGQHHAREIGLLVEIARNHPWDLIIGNRRLKEETVPEISKFGRKFSNFWVNYETGSEIKDSQSGFRLYPLLPIQTMRFFTKRYDFEIEVLIRLIWAGIKVRETEIDVYYPQKNERVSHFHKFWDNLRISNLNILLVTVSLLKTHRSPVDLALALGIGVFIGLTPFYGFHMLMGVAFALLFRLNAIILIIGTNIPNPVIAWPLFIVEQHIGAHWMHLHTHSPFMQLVAGSFVVGPFFGLVTFFSSLLISHGVKKKLKNPSNWTGRARGGKLGNGFLKIVLRYAGLKAGYFCLYFIVPYFYIFAPTGRRGLDEYWSLMDPSLSWWARQKKIAAHFLLYGRVLMDRVFQSFNPNEPFVTKAEGLDNILGQLQKNEGLVMLTAHIGGWDLGSTLLGKHGFKNQINVVEYRSQGFNFQSLRKDENDENVRSLNSAANHDAIFEIHQTVREGRFIALMGDRPLGDRFELIPFFGKLAPFDVTAFRLAAATQAPLLFTFSFKGQGNQYEFFAGPAKVYTFDSSLPRPLQCYEWAREYVEVLEKFLRRYPDQWFNFYPFWSRLPTAPSGGLASQTHNSLVEELMGPPVLKPQGSAPEKS